MKKIQEEKDASASRSDTITDMIDDIEMQLNLNRNQTTQKGMTLMQQIAQINEQLVEHQQRREDLAQGLEEEIRRVNDLEEEVKADAEESKAADDSILEAISLLEGDSKSRDETKHNCYFYYQSAQNVCLGSVE